MVLVVGGAGFIGSHMVKMLAALGHGVVTLDNLSTGHKDAVVSGVLVKGDLLCEEKLRAVFAEHPVNVVMHFAGNINVGESVRHPRQYYSNNVKGTLNLLDAMLDAGVTRLVFSSSCATYGLPQKEVLDEFHPQWPVNPYGWSKLMVEQMLSDFSVAYGLKSISLRYFNAAGSDSEGVLGERHNPETHLIPLVLQEALRVKRGGDPGATTLRVYGDDFNTPDGTCVRDYIHVEDICRGHLAAFHRLVEAPLANAEAFNLGSESGFSVKEIVDVCRRVTGVDIHYVVEGRRQGDPPKLVADASKARKVLGWTPTYLKMEDIVGTAWNYIDRECWRGT